MDSKIKDVSELNLPEIKENKATWVYAKIVFFPILFFVITLLAYLNKLEFGVPLLSLALMGVLLLSALFFAKYNAEYEYNSFMVYKDEFKQALKSYIMKYFLTIGKSTKCSGDFDSFAQNYLKQNSSQGFAFAALGVFPILGILGTFICIASFIPEFKSNDIALLEQELSELLSGIASAFYVCIYGIFLSLWWLFFDKLGKSKIQKLLTRQKNATSSFFWTKEELNQRYLSESLRHFESLGVVFKQVIDGNFFIELDHVITRKFDLFRNMLDTEEKAIRIGNEHIKQNMSEIRKAQREQKDLTRVYSDIINAISALNQSYKETSLKISEQYYHLLENANQKNQNLDKVLKSLNHNIEQFSSDLQHYKQATFEKQDKFFEDFRTHLFDTMSEFKKIYDSEKELNKLEDLQEFKTQSEELDKQTNELIARLNQDQNTQETLADENR